MDTDTGHYHQTQVTDQQATVFNGIRHGQNPSPNIALRYNKTNCYCLTNTALLSYFQHVYYCVGVGYLVIRPAVILVIVVSQLSSVGVSVALTDDGEAGDDDLFAMDNLWTARDRGCCWVFLFLRF